MLFLSLSLSLSLSLTLSLSTLGFTGTGGGNVELSNLPHARTSHLPVPIPHVGIRFFTVQRPTAMVTNPARRTTAVADPREAHQQKKRNGMLLAALATIHSQCVRAKERQHTARQLHARLNHVFLRATSGDDANCAVLGQSRRAAAFIALVDAFHLTLKRHIKFQANIVRRVLHHRMFSLQLRSIHHQLTAFLRDAGANEAFPFDWRSAFELALAQDEKMLYETLGTVLKSTSFLGNEYLKLSTHQQMEVLLNVRHERQQTIDMSPLLNDCLKLIYRNLVKLFGWDLNEKSRRVPHWFVPTSAVDFSSSRDLLTKQKRTYRGEIGIAERGGLKRHLITLKFFNSDPSRNIHVDEKAQLMETFLTKYGAITHQHVLPVRGANFAAGSPFVVRNYATKGTLAGHLARLRHDAARKDQLGDSLKWRLLADACEGLLHIHEEDFVSHGGLKGSNLLVNHRGRACIADAGVRVLRDRLGAATPQEEGEYVRWLAPELLATADGKVHVKTSMVGDVYAFGMCILEVLTNERPWSGLSSATVEDMKRANDTVLPPQPSHVADREWRLVQKMCAADPIARLPLRQAYSALVELSRGTEGDVVPPSIRIDMVTVDDEAQDQAANEFETESVSSYKTTLEVDETMDYGGSIKAVQDADSMAVEIGDEDEQDDSEDALDDAYEDGGIRPSAVGLGLQTNGQMKNAIEYLADYQTSPSHELLPHLKLLRAFAKEEASAIHESGGVRVLAAIFTRHHDAQLRGMTLEIYTAMLQSRQAAVADALAEQGIVAMVFEFFKADGTAKPQQDVCASLLLDLMGLSDRAKQQIGDPDKKYVALLDANENVHHRVVTEIKSVLARFKQA
jgi:serine/threonine protein kinase